jgi:transposase
MALGGSSPGRRIVLLALRMRLSRASIRELLRDVFDLTLSTGVIDETIREAGRASFPLEDALVADIVQVAQLHVDETSWPEPACCCGCGRWSDLYGLYLIGPRTREMLENALQDGYTGILISDGYGSTELGKPPALLAAPDAQAAGAGRIE